MKIGVMADTHGNVDAAVKASIELDKCGAGVLVHLGDSVVDAFSVEKNTSFVIEKILGNNEENHNLPQERIFDWNGFRVLAIHGHRERLNRFLPKEKYFERLGKIAERAVSAKAGLVLFGHTHFKEDITICGVRFLNPGALDLGANEKTCLLIDLSCASPAATFIAIR